MIRVIEHSKDHVIQKITKGSSTVGYNVVPKGRTGDASAIVRVPTLTEARSRAGINTAPKATPVNTKH